MTVPIFIYQLSPNSFFASGNCFNTLSSLSALVSTLDMYQIPSIISSDTLIFPIFIVPK